MKRWTNRMKAKLCKCLILLSLAGAPFMVRASNEAPFAGLDLTNLEKQASERVIISLDKQMIAFTASFLSKEDPDLRKIIQNLEGIYVRCFTFEHEKAYSSSDVEAIRKQLGSDWSRLVEVRGHENVDFYVKRDAERIKGFVLIAAEPSEVTVINIQGNIQPEELKGLEGFAGIPKGILKPEKETEKDKTPSPEEKAHPKK